MKLSCNVARDLLPLYHDGVCSAESRGLVEAHLEECPDCTELLKELRGEIELPHQFPDDEAVLKKLERYVGRSRRRAWIRGASAVLAVVLLVLGGWYVRWYVNDHCYYQKFAEEHEPRYEKNMFEWTNGSYSFFVIVPEYPGDPDEMLYVRREREENTVNITPGQEVYVWLNFGREEYAYLVGVEVRTRTQVSGEPRLKTEVWTEFLMLDRELELVLPDYMNEQMRTWQAQVYQDYYQQIVDIVHAAQAEWPFLAEE